MGLPRSRGNRLALVRAVVSSWAPYGLPGDEFEREISAVVRHIDRIASPVDAAHCLSRVFTSSFGDPARFSIDVCFGPGLKLYDALVAERIIVRHD